MSQFHSDALVLFGAKGDLAFKKIFPALHALVKRAAWMFRSSLWPEGIGISSSYERP